MSVHRAGRRVFPVIARIARRFAPREQGEQILRREPGRHIRALEHLRHERALVRVRREELLLERPPGR
jgi:hypothetical protein